MKNLISGMLAVIFFIILAFGGVLIWDIAGNDGKITNSFFIKIENEDEDLKTHDCEFDTEYSYNNNSHWFACFYEDCYETKYESAHVFEWVVDKEPTYTAQGIKHEACVCGAIRNEYTVVETLPIKSTLKFIFETDTVYNGVACKKIENEKTAQASIVKSDISYYRENNFYEDYNPTLFNIRWQSETTDTTILTVGASMRLRGNSNIVLRAVPGNSKVPYTFDILYGGVRYRLIDVEKISAIFEDYKKCGYIDFEIGSFKHNGVVVYGFRFSTENEELTYLNDNSGTLKNETMLFRCDNSNSASGTEELSLDWFFGGLDNHSIDFDNSWGSISATTLVSYETDESATYVSIENTSDWLLSKIKEN